MWHRYAEQKQTKSPEEFHPRYLCANSIPHRSCAVHRRASAAVRSLDDGSLAMLTPVKNQFVWVRWVFPCCASALQQREPFNLIQITDRVGDRNILPVTLE